jgi:signal peptidase II
VNSANPKTEIRNPKSSPLRSPAALALFVLTMAIGLAVDLWSKSYSWNALAIPGTLERDSFSGRLRVESETSRAIPEWLHFKVTLNEGAVFGLGQGNQVLFGIVSVLAIGFLTYLFITSGTRRFYQFVLGMLLAGVLGNLYDRMVYRYVRDMIYALPGWQWPGEWVIPGINYPGPGREVFPWIFNIADTLLCVGVGLMILYSLFAHDAEREAGKKDDEPAVQPARS